MRLSSLQLGVVTVPRLPSEPRWETLAPIFSDNPLIALAGNLVSMLCLLSRQTDGHVRNTVEPFGYFYTLTFPLAITGIIQLLLPTRRSANLPERLLLLSWLMASLITGILQPVNINRINLIFIPLILCIALPLVWLGDRWRLAQYTVLGVLLVSFGVFHRQYHSDHYRTEANGAFFTGLLPAIAFARQASDIHNPICVTGSVNMPYIFVLFKERMNPADYVPNIKYLNPQAPFREVRTLGRYNFGVQYCPPDQKTIYILNGEQPPYREINYRISNFGDYKVYVP
jgi:hypothetical protein